MKLLLDTQVFLWAVAEPHTLAADARAAIENPHNLVALSAASVWEIAIKRAIGTLRFPGSVTEVGAATGFTPLAISGAHAEAAGALPPHHRDPFDRMLIAQATLEGLVLATRDEALAAYAVDLLPA